MSRILVTYFSASGVTAALAKTLAETIGADLSEIRPAVPYTKADLDWRDSASRSTLEMRDPASRPAIEEPDADPAAYDVIFVGFPIWWYQAPTIINTYLEKYDLAGKTIVPFATSGSSGMGSTNEKLRPSCPDSRLLEGRVLRRPTAAELTAWVESLAL